MKYKSKVIQIEAIKFEYNREGIAAVKQFLGNAFVCVNKDRHPSAIGRVEINTGMYRSFKEGDYIIKNFAGEFYPCKAGYFETTYEPVNNEDVEW